MRRALKPHEIEREIDERVEGQAAEYWNGMCRSGRDEYVILADREGVDAAINELIAAAASPADD